MSGEEKSFALAMEIYYIGLFVHKKNNSRPKGPSALRRAVQVGKCKTMEVLKGSSSIYIPPVNAGADRSMFRGFPTFGIGEIDDAVDQADMGKGLRKIAEE